MHAWFLKGRIAADHGDAAGIGNALAALGGSSNPELRADRLELTGRLELLEDRPERALAVFRDSADLRRDAEDYLGMARVLALAGEAAERAGLGTEAADLYFRAGRSAEVERDPSEITKSWLGTLVLTETADEAEAVKTLLSEAIGPDWHERSIVGDADDIVEQVSALVDTGVDLVIVNMPTSGRDNVARAGELLVSKLG